jgi:hypothetical protein
MRTTLDLPDPLFRELKTRAARQGKKLKELVTLYVEVGLYGPEVPAQAPERPPRSPLPVARRATGHTIPAMTNAKLQSLLDDEDAKRCR